MPLSNALLHAPQEKEKLYVELKNILARQPGPEVAEQVALYQGSLRDKTKQLKAMASELNMCQAQARRPTARARGGGGWGGAPGGSCQPQTQGGRRPGVHRADTLRHVQTCAPQIGSPFHRTQVAEYKYEIERLSRELSELKRRWFEAKKREQQQQQHQQQLRSSGGGALGALGAGAGGGPGSLGAPGGGGSGAQLLAKQQLAGSSGGEALGVSAAAPPLGAVKGGGFAMT